MLKPRTLILILLSLLVGLIAVKTFGLITSRPAPKPKAAIEKKAPPPVKRTYSDSVPKGRRVVSIKVDEVSGATRALEQGDRVDVIAITAVPGARGGKIARVVLQNVVIHDVEQSFFKKQITDKAVRKKKTWTLQLLVNLSQAVTLSSVDEAATLRLVLRNPGDEAIETIGSIFYSPQTGPGPAGAKPPELSARVAPGMRAISLPVDNKDGLCNSLVHGDRVDVVVSFLRAAFISKEGQKGKGDEAQYTGTEKSSRIYLQDVAVLNTEPAGNALTDAEKPVTRVTLMVSPKQAEKVAVVTDAARDCKVRLILRHPGDRKKIATRGEYFQSQLSKAKAPSRVIYIFKGARKADKSEFYE